MKVYVIMGNDYPHSVYQSEADADDFVKVAETAEKEMEKRPVPQRERRRIHWRSYEFELK